MLNTHCGLCSLQWVKRFTTLRSFTLQKEILPLTYLGKNVLKASKTSVCMPRMDITMATYSIVLSKAS